MKLRTKFTISGVLLLIAVVISQAYLIGKLTLQNQEIKRAYNEHVLEGAFELADDIKLN